MRAGFVIFVYSLLFTSLVSFFAYALIPDDIRMQYKDNLISGIAMYLSGPLPVKLMFQGFIVIVGFLMLAGALNTSIIGSNGGVNRVSTHAWRTDWCAAQHQSFATAERHNQRKLDKSIRALDQFTLNYQPEVSLDTVRARPGSVLVAARDFNTLSHLDYALERTDTEAQDIVVMTARLIRGPDAG